MARNSQRSLSLPVVDVTITSATCEAPPNGLDMSRKYGLVIGANHPTKVAGLDHAKSAPTHFKNAQISWNNPFGPHFTLMPSSPDCSLTINLRQYHLVHKDQDVASFTLDCSTICTTQTIQLPLALNHNSQSARLSVTLTISGTNVEKDVISATPDCRDTPLAAVGLIDAALSKGQELYDNGAPIAEDIMGVAHLESMFKNLDGFMQMADLAANVSPDVDDLIHPIVRLAWGVVSVAYQMTKAQVLRDGKINKLIQEMDGSCKMARDVAPLRERAQDVDEIVPKILNQVIECTYFVKGYWEQKSFGLRLARNLTSGVDEKIEMYIGSLQKLRDNLSGQTNISTSLEVCRVFDTVKIMQETLKSVEVRGLFNEMPFASKARPNLEDVCLPGTRVEIIEAIVAWALDADLPSDRAALFPIPKSARILWLCGVAGSGKSQIARSVAKTLQEHGRLGSMYFCDAQKKTDLHVGNLFSTIAQHLSKLDPLRERRLADEIKDDKAVRATELCKEQFQRFIVAPSEELPVIGNTVIVIDAFDELGGDPRELAGALSILTQRANELPDGIRILVTSRFELNVQKALNSASRSHESQVGHILMDSIPMNLTTRDIEIYVRRELEEDFDSSDRDRLVSAAGTSFEWIRTACHFIKETADGRGALSPRRRFNSVLASNRGLDSLYGGILDQHFGGSEPEELEMLTHILGHIVCAEEPLSLQDLALLNSRSLPGASTALSLDDYRRIVRQLASLLVNTHCDDKPVSPFHKSFVDFVCAGERSLKYHVKIEEANKRIVLGCIDVMKRELRFNICELPTSFKANSDIENIGDLVQKNISPVLLYACRFWPKHFDQVRPFDDSVSAMLVVLLKQHFLEWLEVMSLRQLSFHALLALLKPPQGELATLLAELKSFASHFAIPICRSAAHIYLSALTFAPTLSLFHQVYKQYPQMAEVKRGRMLKWPSLVHRFAAHSGGVDSVAFSPDGTRIVSSAFDHTVRLWNAQTGADNGALVDVDRVFASVAFSSDGSQIWSGTWEGTIYLLNAETGEIDASLIGHTDTVTSLALSPHDKVIASASHDNTIRLWDVATEIAGSEPLDSIRQLWDAEAEMEGSNPLNLIGHADQVTCVAFSPDGGQVVSASRDRTIRLWDVGTGEAIGEPFKGHTGAVMCVAFFPKLDQVVSASEDESIRVWNMKTGTAVGKPLLGHRAGVYSLAFSPDGSLLVSGSGDGTVRLWSVENWAAAGEPLLGHSSVVNQVAFSSLGTHIVSCSQDTTIRLWDVQLALAVGERSAGDINIAEYADFAVSRDGLQVVGGSANGTIRLWDLESGAEVVGPITGHTDAIESVAFSPIGDQIVSGSRDRTVRLWNAKTGTALHEPFTGHSRHVKSVAFSHDGKQIVSGSEDQTIRLWDAKTGAAVGGPFKGHTEGVKCVSFSPNDDQIVSCSTDGTIRLWTKETGAAALEPIHAWLKPTDGSYMNIGSWACISSLAFSHVSPRIVSGAYGDIRVWDAETGALVCTPFSGDNMNNPIESVTFSPDDTWLASGSLDKTIRLWDAATGAAISDALPGPTSGVVFVEFLSSRNHLVSCGSDGTILVWKVKAGSVANTTSSTDQTPASSVRQPTLFLDETLQLQDDGWLVDPDGRLILWIPPLHRILDVPHRRVIHSPYPITELDFSSFKCGSAWAQCRERERS